AHRESHRFRESSLLALKRAVFECQFVREIALVHLGRFTERSKTMSVAEVPHRIGQKARRADFVGQEEPTDGPSDLRADCVYAILRGVKRRRRVVQKHSDAMKKLQSA